MEYFLEENLVLKAKVKTLETRVAKKLEYFCEENLDLKAKMKILESKLKSQQDVNMTLSMHLDATIEEIKMLRNTIAEMQNQMSHNQKPYKQGHSVSKVHFLSKNYNFEWLKMG